jgi:amino acid transporter
MTAGASRPTELKRALGGVQFLAMGLGKVVGVGWLVVLGSWLTQAGPLGVILAFAAGGLAISMIGLCYAEMAAMRPVAGGEVPWVFEVFGTKMAFAIGWAIALITVAVTAFEAISVGWIVGTLVPGIEGRTLYTALGEPVRLGSLLLGVGGTIALTILNYRGVRPAAGLQDVATYVKLAICALFITAGIAMGDVDNMRPLFQGDSAGSAFRGFLAVFVTASFWYSGFQIIPQMMEERAVGASVTRAAKMIVLCLAIALVFYCGVVLAASMAMPWKQLAATPLPVASAFEVALASPWLAKAVLVSALLGLVTVWNATFLTASRILFALGRGRILHPAFARLHPRYGVPVVPILITGILGTAATFLGRNAIEPIVNLGGMVYAFSFLLIALAVIRLRRTRPHDPRPYRIPGGLLVPVLAAVLAGTMMLVSIQQQYRRSPDGIPLEWMLLVGWGLLGVGAWIGGRRVRASIDDAERRALMLPLDR